MSVLLLSENFPPRVGGAGAYAAELARRVEGVDVEVMTSEQPGDAEHDAAYPRRVRRIDTAFDGWGKLGLRGWRRYRELCGQVRDAIDGRTRVILANRCLPEGEASRCVAESARLAFAVVVHGEELNTAHTSRELARLTRRVLRRADAVIANSRHTAGLLAGDWGVTEGRLTVVTPGVEAEAITPATQAERTTLRRRLGWDGRRVVLTASRLQARKGHDRMIEAWRRVSAAVPDARWVIVGDGPTREALRALARERGVVESIDWVDPLDRDGLIDRYRACDLFALPNRTVHGDFEGFGIVLLEAQAAGRPVLCGRSGGTRETIVEGVTGRSVDASSSRGLSDALIALLSDVDGLERMGIAAREHVAERHVWDRSAELLSRTLLRLAEGRELTGGEPLRRAA
ncbi:MAG: glycosyltransferase family 4 protein [Planctomycetota bacterium]